MNQMNDWPESIAALVILAILCLVVESARADNLYANIGVGYIFSQPTSIDYTQGRLALTYSPLSAHFESGFRGQQWAAGMHYAKGSGDFHDPSKLELFVDYDWLADSKWHLVTGIGYKLMYQEYVVNNGQKAVYNLGDSDDYSARIGVSRTIGSYEVGVWHHSQWFTGVPINETWEYHKTEVTIIWVF
jgi:hypothetical protein